ncbi:sigma-54-dependent transcriptional regulator [Pseudorhodoferax soli]|uniref:Two-component system C4-dicarboxylate transport response regulator DctD n=1 Tax=Pseudorhodoferax soli TaxID=545864 RepID=A0A368XA74_9BURK|nr:sigma-54 dependent transcriptional regulator [Pseudorhodoferax soli]RCW64745.1 two-component system C4-dicarboxylate transport response regulator DctD [Pseudorhodoferax soli]
MNPSALSVLIVEDDPHVQLGCVQAIQLAGLPVTAVASAEEAHPLVRPGFAGVVITDMRLPGQDGLALIRWCQQRDADMPVIMITGHGDVGLAVEAMRSGAYDFIPKPFSPEALVEIVRRALEKRALTLEVAALRKSLASRAGLESQLIGNSPQMQRVRHLVAEVADSPVDVLVHGETGTGKEVVAQALHTHSTRRGNPFVALNCGGMPDNLLDSELFGHESGAFTGAQKRRIGKIEHAHGGTLFLDELESMPPGMQIKLLRVLQERRVERLGSNEGMQVDVRVVAATKENLLQRAREGGFRLDLYYRLNVVTIELPALRERREDVPLLTEHFMLLAASRYNRPHPGVTQEQLRRLMAHDWPGNVRELRNMADCLVLGIPSGVLGAGEVPAADVPVPSLTEMVDTYERGLIAAELSRNQGNVAHSARALRIAKTTLADKVRKHGLL